MRRHSWILIMILLGLGVGSAFAAVFVVNSPGDDADANPGDGICETASSNGVCTLRAAIQEANASATTNDLQIVLSGAGTVTLSNALPVLTVPITILGPGEIDGGGNAGLVLGGGNSTVQSLTIHGCQNGIVLRDNGGNVITNCLIGTDPTGSLALGNLSDGVRIANSSGNRIVDDLIAFNGGAGVNIASGTNNFVGRFLGQPAIFANAGLGIDLGGDGVTTNDVLDADAGPNNLQNFPVLTSVFTNSTSTVLQGTLNSSPSTVFALGFYANVACDPSGFGQGQTPIGSASVLTDGGGHALFNLTNPVVVATGQFITATATDPDGNTSEFSPCFVVPVGGASADLAVNVVAAPGPAPFPSPLTYTVTVVNNGPSIANDVTFSDTLSAQATFRSVSTGCSTSAPGTVACNLGTLVSGETTNVVITVLPEQDRLLTNLVSVVADEPDPVSSNNSAATVTLSETNALSTIGFSAANAEGSTFFAALRTVAESSGDQVALVERQGATARAVSVAFGGFDNTAVNGTDYVVTNGTLNFGPGETSKPLPFHLNARPGFQGDRLFYLTLNNPQPGGKASLGLRVLPVVIVESERPAAPVRAATVTLLNGTTVGARLGGAGSVAVTPVASGNVASSSRVDTATVADNDINIVISGTDRTSALTITVKAGAASPRQVNIQSLVAGGGLKSLNLKSADLGLGGLLVGGPLGSLAFHDITNGAPVIVGGTPTETTTVKAHVLGDDSTFIFGSAIKSLAAARIGQSTLIAPSLGSLSLKGDKKLRIAGDCGADIELSGVGVDHGKPALGKVVVANIISNALFNVTGNIGSVSAAQLIDSLIFAGFTAADSFHPFAGGEFVAGLKISSVAVKARTKGFVDSVVAAAQVGTVKLASVETVNLGQPFGVLASESIKSVTVKVPPFKWDPAGAADQGRDDFHVAH